MHTSLAHAPAVHARDRDRTFFTAVAIANALIIVAGFGYSTYARLHLGDPRFGGPALPTLVRLHAAVSTVWTVLLIVQTRLIAANRTRLHRRLGIAGAVTAAAVVGLGWVVAVGAMGRGINAGEPGATMAVRFFILPVQELVVFAILVGAALCLRKRADYHKRLMLLGTIALDSGGADSPLLSRQPAQHTDDVRPRGSRVRRSVVGPRPPRVRPRSCGHPLGRRAAAGDRRVSNTDRGDRRVGGFGEGTGSLSHDRIP